MYIFTGTPNLQRFKKEFRDDQQEEGDDDVGENDDLDTAGQQNNNNNNNMEEDIEFNFEAISASQRDNNTNFINNNNMQRHGKGSPPSSPPFRPMSSSTRGNFVARPFMSSMNNRGSQSYSGGGGGGQQMRITDYSSTSSMSTINTNVHNINTPYANFIERFDDTEDIDEYVCLFMHLPHHHQLCGECYDMSTIYIYIFFILVNNKTNTSAGASTSRRPCSVPYCCG